MKVSSSSRKRGCLTAARIASVLLLASATGACGDTREQEEARARRARQMRDVSRMLDAMEAADPSAAMLTVDAPFAEEPRIHAPAGSPDTSSRTIAPSWPQAYGLFFAAGGLATGGAGWWVFVLIRRRAKATPFRQVPSIAGYFAEAEAEAKPVPAPRPAAASASAPAWVYRSSPFETPDLEVIAEPVDLLLPFVSAPDTHTVASQSAMAPRHTLRERLTATDPNGSLHLVGDERFPDVRCTGKSDDAGQAWHDILDATSNAAGDDGRLARWLLPALCVLRARDASRQEAERLLDMAEGQTSEALQGATGDERSHGFARWIRIRLAKAARQSGATRLFAVRDLLADLANDPRYGEALALDACIDAQLAWASWLYGDAATTRLDEAERVCERLGNLGSDAATLALRRRGEIWLRRAQLRKPSVRLPDLERAQALLDDAHDRQPNAETALLVAQAARQRARLLKAADAATACSHALLHAFLAEQDPAWRIDALVCRLDIQLTYEALPEHAALGSVTAALGRSLEEAGPVPSAARLTVAEARLHDGDHAGAAGMCEAIWRDHSADDRVLDLWRDACRRWANDADHDSTALTHARRRLAIARSTL